MCPRNLFARRAYIVCRVKRLRKGTRDIDGDLADLSYFADDRESYMVKALSWALREATKSAPEKVSDFLDEYRELWSPPEL